MHPIVNSPCALSAIRFLSESPFSRLSYPLQNSMPSKLAPPSPYSPTPSAQTWETLTATLSLPWKDREIRGFNTWFVYEGHAEVLANGKVVYSQVEHESPQIVRIIRDTLLKREPVQSVALPPEARVPVEAGTELDILAYASADDDDDDNNHIKFTLASEADYINGFNTWFVFEKRCPGVLRRGTGLS